MSLAGSDQITEVIKGAEFGVDRIVPFTAARSVVRWDAGRADANHRRLQKVAIEAAMQSRQAWVPDVAPIATFAAAAALDGAVLADRGGSAPGLDRPVILVGPEGGWDDDERAALDHVALGPAVLRAETAAIVAGALLVALRAAVVAPAR